MIPKCHKKPTVSEIVAHNRSHTPYRSWCKHCVAGRAPNLPHRPRRPDQGALKNEIAADYCFLRNAARDVSQPVLVARDRRTGIYIAHAVPFKGAGVEWIAKQMLRDVRKCGYHGRVVFRTDGEPAILDLMGEVARLRGDLPTVLEHGAPGDSQSNGFVERAIRSVEDMIRTHKLALEEKIGEVLKVDTAAMAWLVEHCADILNKCQQGKDGRTPYERLRGKQFSGSMLEFGSQVMLKVMDKVSGGLMQERWVEGTWLGSRFTTLEHLVARKSDGVVVRTRAVRDLQKSPTVEDLDRIIGHPHAPQGVQRYRRLDVPRPETVPEPEEHRPATAPDPSRPIPRAVYITRAMLERHGYSEGCQRCNAMRRGQTYGTGGHSGDCRRRMEAALAQDEEYQFKVEQANFRKDQYLAEEVERSAKRRRETSEGSEGHVTGPGDQELPEGGTQDDPEMMMENHETKETSSSRESGQRSAERRESSMQGGSSAKLMMNSKKNEKKPAGREALKVATSCQFLKQAHQLPRMGMEKSTWEVQGNQPN